MTTTRRIFLLTSAAVWASSHWASAAWADTFPSKPLTLVVPFPPGGNIDMVGRGVSIPLGRILSQSVVIDNRGGGGGSVGAAMVARAKPDGYTLLVGTPGQLVTVPQMIKTPYLSSSFEPIGLACKTNMVLVSRQGDSRFGSLTEVIELMKKQPGEITIGHPGIGTPNHLAILQLESQLGIQFNSVAYQGSAPALIDLQAGVIDLQMDQVSSSLPNLKAGKFQALAVLGPTSDPKLPGVPTLEQAGYPSIDGTTYTGIYAPANLPADVLATLSAALEQAVGDDRFAHNMAELGSIATFMAPEAFQNIIDQEEAVAKQMAAAGRLLVN